MYRITEFRNASQCILIVKGSSVCHVTRSWFRLLDTQRPLQTAISNSLPPRWKCLESTSYTSNSQDSSRHHVPHTGNCSITVYPTISHHIGKWLKTNGPTSPDSTVWLPRPADVVTYGFWLSEVGHWKHRSPLPTTTSGLLPPRWKTLGID